MAAVFTHIPGPQPPPCDLMQSIHQLFYSASGLRGSPFWAPPWGTPAGNGSGEAHYSSALCSHGPTRNMALTALGGGEATALSQPPLDKGTVSREPAAAAGRGASQPLTLGLGVQEDRRMSTAVKGGYVTVRGSCAPPLQGETDGGRGADEGKPGVLL